MTTTILEASVAIVNLGNVEFEGLLLEDGSFGIAQQQVASLFSVIPTSAPKWLKGSLGKESQLFSVNTDRNKRVGRQNRSEKAITLEDFEKLLFELTLKGNEQAVEMSRRLIGLSLNQLYSDAFNVKFEQEEREAYLKARPEGKRVRRSMTDAIKAWCDRNLVSKKIQPYCIFCSDILNVHLFGKTSKQMKEERGVKTNALLRDTFTSDELRSIERIEDKVILLSDSMDIKPTDAMKQVIEHDKGSH